MTKPDLPFMDSGYTHPHQPGVEITPSVCRVDAELQHVQHVNGRVLAPMSFDDRAFREMRLVAAPTQIKRRLDEPAAQVFRWITGEFRQARSRRNVSPLTPHALCLVNDQQLNVQLSQYSQPVASCLPDHILSLCEASWNNPVEPEVGQGRNLCLAPVQACAELDADRFHRRLPCGNDVTDCRNTRARTGRPWGREI